MADFKYIESIIPSKRILNQIKSNITSFTEYPFDTASGETPIKNNWVVQSEVTDVSGNTKELVLKGVATIGKANPLSRTIYVRLRHAGLNTNPPGITYNQHSTIIAQIVDDYSASTSTFATEGHPVLIQFADEKATPTDRNLEKPVYIYMNMMNNRLAMVLVGDPSVNFTDYRKTFMYFGCIEPFKYNEDDVTGNVLLTGGAVIDEPSLTSIASGSYNFGVYTSPGNNTFQMYATKSGIKFQKFYPSFITQAPPVGKAYIDSKLGDTGLALEAQGFQASKWTNKYHLTPIYVVHGYEGYRGKLQNVIALTRHNILHLDELIIDVEGKTWKQEVYKYFDINTECNFMKMSANQQMSVAILKEVRY